MPGYDYYYQNGYPDIPSPELPYQTNLPTVGIPYRQDQSWWERNKQNLFNLVSGIVQLSQPLFMDKRSMQQARMSLSPTGRPLPRMSRQQFDAYAQEIALRFGVSEGRAREVLYSLLGDQAPPKTDIMGIPYWLLVAGGVGVAYWYFKKQEEEGTIEGLFDELGL